MSPHPLLKIFKGPEAVDKVLMPIHNMSFLLLFLGTLTVQPVIIEILGPLKDMLTCFLVTFPFTLGLTILFVIILNFNWNKVTGASIIITMALLTLFFWLMIFISHKLDLESLGRDIQKKQILEKIASLNKELKEEEGLQSGGPYIDSAGRDTVMPPGNSAGKNFTHVNVDSIFAIHVVNSDGTIKNSGIDRETKGKNSLTDSLRVTEDKLKEVLVLSKKHPEIGRNLKRQADEISKLKFDIDRPDPWYMKIGTIGPFIATLVYFKIVMGTGGFLSAILLAGFFAFYIQRLGNWMSRKKEKMEIKD